MQHSGSFVDSSGSSYMGGKANYFDFCEPSDMNMDALYGMARQIGHRSLLKFYCSAISPSDCSSLVVLVSDDDVKNVARFGDTNRVVGIFIGDFDPLSTMESQVRSSSVRVDDLTYDANGGGGGFVDVPTNRVEKGNMGNAHVGGEDDNVNDMVDLVSYTDSSSDSSEEESDSDYVNDDGFDESDFDSDDELFDENIDKEIEWVGLVDETIVERGTKNGQSNMEPLNATSKKPRNKEKSKFLDFPVYDDDADTSDFEFEIGMQFKGADEFREAVRAHSNKQGRPLKFTKNCSDKIQVTCRYKTFQVKTMKNQHTCTREASSKHCTSKFLAKKYQNHIRSNPELPVYSMQEIMQMENQTLLSISKMYRAKKHAAKLINGTESEQYAKLWDYCEEIRRTNSNTTVKIKCKHVIGSGECTFKSIYICWGALKKGFLEGCRPVIGLDGTHLKTERGGVLLTAVGIDGNNNMYPISYAVVLKENRKTWDWFIELLIDDLNIQNSYAYTIISDKQKGLIRAVEDLLPHAEHRFCVRHMYNNFQTKHKGLQLKELVWKAATATRVVDFNRVMGQLKVIDPAAYKWVEEKPPKHWSRSHFSTWPKCDLLLNNFCESFNKSILKARNKPIITMLEIIRMIIFKRLPTQRDRIMKAHGEVCPAVQKILEKNKKNAHLYVVYWNGEDIFEVKGWAGDSWTVNLPNKTCSCRKWELSGLPCVHAIACLNHKRYRVEDNVSHWYNKSTYIKAYKYLLQPIKGKDEWPDSQLLPLVPWPEKPKKAGRPKQHARRKDPNELVQEKENGKKLKRNGYKYFCSNCGLPGHNIKTCKEDLNLDTSKVYKFLSFCFLFQ
ncbi:hypothetical protein ACJIZ3_011449 [Penstemon smallii]|uniref:SWIM-type domain-containing protein n=1 Tax=Penstemon smallii TaxID=265156 RepID=A0ABD3UKG6_9LAMI